MILPQRINASKKSDESVQICSIGIIKKTWNVIQGKIIFKNEKIKRTTK